MLRIQRIYAYQLHSGEAGVFLDRLYPCSARAVPAQQGARAILHSMRTQPPDTVLLTAVKQPRQSHIAVLIGEMGEKASYDGD